MPQALATGVPDTPANASAERGLDAVHIAAIIVTYRSAELTLEALRSLHEERMHSKLHISAVVVDNASGDLAIIRPAVAARGWDQWVTLFEAPRNGGFAYGNNLGMRCAHTEGAPDFYYLLNPDAQVRCGAVAQLMRFLQANPVVGIAGSSFENLDGSPWPIAFRFPTLWSELNDGLGIGIVTKLLHKWVIAIPMEPCNNAPVDWICGASMMIRPEVIAATGGFDANYFLYFEETDFCFRARQAGYSTWYVPASRVMHIAGQSTQVTAAHRIPRRLPPYWFESRRRYFVVTYGLWQAMFIDIVAVMARSIGYLKHLLTRRREQLIPSYIRDLVHYSVIWRRNRHIPPAGRMGSSIEGSRSSPHSP